MDSTRSRHSSAKYKSGKGAAEVETLSDEDDEENVFAATGVIPDEGLSVSTSSSFLTGHAGGPFSAMILSMCPQDVLSNIKKLEESKGQLDFRYDEFGFKVEIEDGPEDSSSKILSIPFVEDPQHRLRWVAFLEFAHSRVVEDLTWSKVSPLLPQSDKLRSMVRTGVPHSLRPHIWPRLCGAVLKRRQANFAYKDIVKGSADAQSNANRQIEKDLLRTLPNNACFMGAESVGVARLRRVLRVIAYLYPDIGYCQGMGVIVCSLLLFLEEEDVFWMMCTIIEDMLPGSYFGRSLLGLQADQKVLSTLVTSYLPDIDLAFSRHDLELSLISLNWFLTLLSGGVHMKILVRVWDCFFYDGAVVLFQIVIAMFKMREVEIRACENSAQLFNLLSNLPGSIEDADQLLSVAFTQVASSLTNPSILAQRKRHLAHLLAEQGVPLNEERAGGSETGQLPKQIINRRKLKRSQSLIGAIFGAREPMTLGGRYDPLDPDDVRLKNVRQTELIVDLKEAVLRICKHFITIDPVNYQRAQLIADYSIESHARDHETFVTVHRSRRKRARALLDFERHDDDELGFRRNDVITIISQKDEHCWIGELNGLRGWFPAKFVELLDERSKCYSALGDDAVTQVITDLVRGQLCQCVKAIFEHGIKRSSVLGGPCHPWLFVEEVANREVQKDFDSVYSRLVLCRTFKLDEDGKVLTPEELLYRAVQQINITHDAVHAQMDVKFRSLICLALNEQVLHLWFELICLSEDVVRRWFQKWSYIRSPGWIQIKCDLRLLAQFAFSLSPDFELQQTKTNERRSTPDQMLTKPLRDGVRDMLVKHHLFSWDL